MSPNDVGQKEVQCAFNKILSNNLIAIYFVIFEKLNCLKSVNQAFYSSSPYYIAPDTLFV